MGDDKLKAMLENAHRKSAEQDEEEKAKKAKREDDIAASGDALASRVLPRLYAAEEEWKDKIKLNINDATKVDPARRSAGVHPQITVSTTVKENVGYVIESFSPGYAAVRHLTGPNKGNSAYQFKDGKIDDFTDDRIDEILNDMLQIAFGLKRQ